ncbi:hypothetical protein L3Q82_004113 [Scortum barcoo]|uniref:Uncharacterized protein n=1 Tax=Scortum barcoo TaxID=214431 RepID=A0ACB8X6T2_9TELE|nr:hypothetical protein L3Q82_004113 [Scortum barcoo]
MGSSVLTSFYRCVVESVLSSCIIVWHGSCSAAGEEGSAEGGEGCTEDCGMQSTHHHGHLHLQMQETGLLHHEGPHSHRMHMHCLSPSPQAGGCGALRAGHQTEEQLLPGSSLRLTGVQSRVYPASRPKIAGTGSSTPVTLCSQDKTVSEAATSKKQKQVRFCTRRLMRQRKRWSGSSSASSDPRCNTPRIACSSPTSQVLVWRMPSSTCSIEPTPIWIREAAQ